MLPCKLCSPAMVYACSHEFADDPPPCASTGGSANTSTGVCDRKLQKNRCPNGKTGTEKEKGEQMNLCSDNHEEICYEGKSCPVCYWKDEVRELEKQIKIDFDEINNLERQLEMAKE